MEAPAWAPKVPVVGAWDMPMRRKASLGVTVLAGALVGFTLVAWLIGARGADLFLLVVLLLLILALAFQALVVVTGLGQQSLAGAGAGAEAAWEAPPEGAPPPAAAPAAITLKCSSCGTVFDVQDSGERPLRHTCPGCGAVGELTEADIGPGVPSETAKAEAAPQAITLKCGSCGTTFDVQDTGERPLRHTCPGCGAEGVLTEEELGPAPAAPTAPATAARVAARPKPAATKKVKTLKLRCKSCSTVFTLRDTGDRPLYHECPGCKATGVLR